MAENVALDGKGIMEWGPVEGTVKREIASWQPTMFEPGHPLPVPAGWAHSLSNPYEEELVFVFACPPAHMKPQEDGGDRVILGAHADHTKEVGSA